MSAGLLFQSEDLLGVTVVAHTVTHLTNALTGKALSCSLAAYMRTHILENHAAHYKSQNLVKINGSL